MPIPPACARRQSRHPGLPVPAEAVAAAVLRRFLPPGVERFCLAIGTAEPRKDLPGLVRAFGAVAGRATRRGPRPRRPARMGRGGPGAAIAASERPGQDRPHGLGGASPTWPRCSPGPALLAYPSLYEGFGFPPLQAMRAGVPVVATRAGSLPEVLGEARLLVDPGDHDGLVGALASCLGDGANGAA